MGRKPGVTAYEILASQQPGRRAVAHRLTEASGAVNTNNPALAFDMIAQADGVRRTLELTWNELLGVDEYSSLAATSTATATAE